MKKTLFLTFFLLFFSFSFSQQRKIDSLKVVLASTKVDTIKLNSYNELIVIYGGQDIELAAKYLDSMLRLSKKIMSKRHELTAYSQEGVLNYRKGDIKEAISIWKKGLAEKEISSYPKQKSNFLNNIAIGYKAFKENDSVLKYLSASINLNEEQKNDIGLIANYFGISDFFFQEREYDKAIEYLTKLQSLALRTGDKHALARTNILLANISRKEYDFQDAINYFDDALNYYIEMEPINLFMIRGLKYEVIKTKITQKRYEETIKDLKALKEKYEEEGEDKTFWHQINLDLLFSYSHTERINEAYPLYKNISQSELELNDVLESQKLAGLTSFEIFTNRISDNTLNRLTKAYQLAKKLKMGGDILYCTELFALYHLKRGNNNLSFNYLIEAKRIRDSLSFSESKIINLSQKRKFNEARKENENLALKQQNAEQALLMEKEKNQKLAIGSGLAVALVGLGVFFFAYRKNQRQKKEIEKQKTLVEELQRELHHRLKNNLSFIDFFITLAKGKFPDPAYSEKLDELQNRINSMFEVHKQLFKKEDVTSVNARTYISALVENVKKAYAVANVTLEENIDDTNLRADTSFPIGLIVNEFVTNSYKYAFPDNREGVISVDFTETADHYLLKLKDNGQGLPENFNIDALDSFGMETIKLLTQEYKGSFILDGSDGLRMEITFPKNAA